MRTRRALLLPWLVVGATVAAFVIYLPGPIGNRLRLLYYRRRLRSLGRGVVIDVGVQIVHPEYVSLGDYVWIDRFVVLIAGEAYEGKRKLARRRNASYEHQPGELVIGDRCHIAPFVVINAIGGVSIGANSAVSSGCQIYSLSHHPENVDDPSDSRMYSGTSMALESDQSLIASPVVLGVNTMIGTNTVVLPGSTVRRDTWIGAASLVRLSVPSGVVAAGVPARVLKRRERLATHGVGSPEI